MKSIFHSPDFVKFASFIQIDFVMFLHQFQPQLYRQHQHLLHQNFNHNSINNNNIFYSSNNNNKPRKIIFIKKQFFYWFLWYNSSIPPPITSSSTSSLSPLLLFYSHSSSSKTPTRVTWICSHLPNPTPIFEQWIRRNSDQKRFSSDEGRDMTEKKEESHSSMRERERVAVGSME